VIELKREIDERKALYDEFDKLVTELYLDKFEGLIEDGKTYNVVDKFEDANVAFTTTSVRRYDLKIRKAK
jgi:hypothetical protein